MAMREDKHFLDLELVFPDVFYDEQGNRKANPGFDAVIGNPPYVGTRLQSTRGQDDEKTFIKSRFTWAIRGFDIYVPFSCQALSLSKERGAWGFIIPNKFWVTDYGEVMKHDLLDTHMLTKLVDVSKAGVFPDANVYPYLVFATRAADESRRSQVPIVEMGKRGEIIKSLTRPHADVAVALSSLLMPSRAVTDNLAEVASVSSGTTGFQAQALVSCIADNPASSEKGCPFIVTGNINRYEITLGNVHYMGQKYSEPFCFFSKDIISSDKWHLYLSPKIVVAGMVTRLETAWYDEGLALGVNLYAVVPSSGLSGLYILALINSKYMTHWYRITFESKHLAGDYLAINKGQLDRLPIRIINFTTPEEERKQLLEQAKELHQEYLQSQDWDKVLIFVAQCLPQKADGTPDTEHEQSDVVHDLLAFLAEEMTHLNKEKQSRIKGFLLWLEKEILKGSVEDQKNKTKIKNFHEHNLEALLDILKKNKVVSDPCPSSTRDTIANEFSSATRVITPLKADIKETDTLIDQIVYKLYSLTDDEIAIVERTGKTSNEK